MTKFTNKILYVHPGIDISQDQFRFDFHEFNRKDLIEKFFKDHLSKNQLKRAINNLPYFGQFWGIFKYRINHNSPFDIYLDPLIESCQIDIKDDNLSIETLYSGGRKARDDYEYILFSLILDDFMENCKSMNQIFNELFLKKIEVNKEAIEEKRNEIDVLFEAQEKMLTVVG